MTTVLVIRDPDYENEYTTEGDPVEYIDIDLGQSFDGPKGFRGELDAEEQNEYFEMWRDQVKHLDPDGPIRARVEELIDYMRGDD
jgi:hypothetical protein